MMQLPSTSTWNQDIEGVLVLFGAGRISELGDRVVGLGGHRVLLVGDPGLTAAGHCATAREALEAAGLAVALFDDVRENPSTRDVDGGVRAARAHQADFLVGLGGGSAMDCAKGINILLANGGEMSTYQGYGCGDADLLPSIGVPTTAGTGSEAQSYALITDHETHTKMACGDARARFREVILDPNLTVTQPRLTAAAGALDAAAHALESFVTTRRTKTSCAYSLEAWRRLDRVLERALAAPKDTELWGEMMIAAHLAGAAIEASMLGAAHACANPLTAHYRTTHGIAVSLMLPHVIRYNAVRSESMYAQMLSSPPTEHGAGEVLARRIEEFRRVAGLPERLRDVGVEHVRIPQLADDASRQWTLGFNPRPAQRTDLVTLYEMAY